MHQRARSGAKISQPSRTVSHKTSLQHSAFRLRRSASWPPSLALQLLALSPCCQIRVRFVWLCDYHFIDCACRWQRSRCGYHSKQPQPATQRHRVGAAQRHIHAVRQRHKRDGHNCASTHAFLQFSHVALQVTKCSSGAYSTSCPAPAAASSSKGTPSWAVAIIVIVIIAVVGVGVWVYFKHFRGKKSAKTTDDTSSPGSTERSIQCVCCSDD